MLYLECTTVDKGTLDILIDVFVFFNIIAEYRLQNRSNNSNIIEIYTKLDFINLI